MSGGEDTATVTRLAKQGERGEGFEAVPGSIAVVCFLQNGSFWFHFLTCAGC